MTLKQAFTMWAATPGNTVLAARCRNAVNMILMKDYGETEIGLINETFARRIFDESKAPQELKTPAASILVFVLKWGHEHDYCLMPTFDYSIASSKTEKKAIKKKEPTVMAEGKPKGGRQAKKVCALDPETFQVIKTYDKITDACKKNGVKNIHKAIKGHYKAAGLYWAYPEDVEGFEPKTYSVPEEMKQKLNKQLDITQISDEDLIKEIRRRGWTGELSITKKVNL